MAKSKKKVTVLRLSDLVYLIQQVRRTYSEEMNTIAAIKVIRETVPDVGLKGAKDFFDFINALEDDVSAVDVAKAWCPVHWVQITNWHLITDRCTSSGYGYPKTVAAEPKMQDNEEYSPAKTVPYPCSCGVGKTPDPSCTNEWHKAAYWITMNPQEWAVILKTLGSEQKAG